MTLSIGTLPHTHTGISGGHVHPLAHLLKVVLYDTVLERVIRDNADASARVEPPCGGVKPSLEHIEFVIDLDANGLETLLGWVSAMPDERQRGYQP